MANGLSLVTEIGSGRLLIFWYEHLTVNDPLRSACFWASLQLTRSFFFGLPSDRFNKFTDRWTYSGEKESFGTSLTYTVSEQVWLVCLFYLSRQHSFIRFVAVHRLFSCDGSRRGGCRVCLLSMRVQNQGHPYAVSHASTAQ